MPGSSSRPPGSVFTSETRRPSSATSPTTSATTSARVTMPLVPPCSSTTTASCRRRFRNSTSSCSRVTFSGTKSTGRCTCAEAGQLGRWPGGRTGPSRSPRPRPDRGCPGPPAARCGRPRGPRRCSAPAARPGRGSGPAARGTRICRAVFSDTDSARARSSARSAVMLPARAELSRISASSSALSALSCGPVGVSPSSRETAGGHPVDERHRRIGDDVDGPHRARTPPAPPTRSAAARGSSGPARR